VLSLGEPLILCYARISEFVNYYLIAAAVFATAKDRKGKQLFSRQWDLNYIGLPAIDKKAQNTPTFEAAEIESILSPAKEPFRVLYCLLAGSGLRIAEAMGLEIGKHFSNDCSIVYVRQQRSKEGHKIEKYHQNRCRYSGHRFTP
jgi:integrase